MVTLKLTPEAYNTVLSALVDMAGINADKEATVLRVLDALHQVADTAVAYHDA